MSSETHAQSAKERLDRWFEYFMHPALKARGADVVLRAKLWLVITFSAFGAALVMGTDHLIRGPREQALLLYIATAVGLLAVWTLRRTGRLELVGNFTTGLAFAVITGAVVIRGGAGSPAQFTYGLIPLMAVLTAGWRSGVVWSVLIGIQLAVFLVLELMGVVIPVRVPEDSQRFSDMAMSAIVTAILVGFSFANEWYRKATTKARERAEQERSAADARRVAAERERERARQEAKLMHAARLASVGELAAGVAHEINNPLAYISGNVEYARELLADAASSERDAELAEVLDDVHEGARRVTRIVADLSTFARESEEHVGIVDLGHAIEMAVKMAEHQIRHRARLDVNLPIGRMVRADGTRLTQLFLNLLINAAHAIPLDDDATDHVITVVVEELDDVIVASVTDSGKGIPDDELHRVMDPFFTTKGVGEGTGLGLSVSQNIAHQYGGELEISSRVGHGTTVTVTLPLAVAPVPEPARDAAPANDRHYRILAVDDEATILRTLERYLKGHTVTAVQSGPAALSELARDDFDVLLCDIMMPDVNGLDLFHRIRELDPELAKRTVFLTGGVFNTGMNEELEKLTQPVIGKPWRRDELFDAIESVAGAS